MVSSVEISHEPVLSKRKHQPGLHNFGRTFCLVNLDITPGGSCETPTWRPPWLWLSLIIRRSWVIVLNIYRVSECTACDTGWKSLERNPGSVYEGKIKACWLQNSVPACLTNMQMHLGTWRVEKLNSRSLMQPISPRYKSGIIHKQIGWTRHMQITILPLASDQTKHVKS